MNEKEIKEKIDIILNESIEDDDGLVDWELISDKINEEELNELLDRGLIYEPILGKIKLI